MSEDLIRRSDAIKAIASLHILADEEKIFKVYADNPHSMTTDFEGTLIDAINAIKGIPTIEPKRGKWKIGVAETIYGKAYLLTCSECGETVSVTETALPYENFCRNCGAKMKGADDE